MPEAAESPEKAKRGKKGKVPAKEKPKEKPKGKVRIQNLFVYLFS